MSHFIPTEFNIAARDVLTLPLAGRMGDYTVVPVTASHDLVEVGLITAPGKGAVTHPYDVTAMTASLRHSLRHSL